MKIYISILAFFAFWLSAELSFTQDIDCVPQYPDSVAIVNYPWYGNNQFLYDYLTNKGYYNVLLR